MRHYTYATEQWVPAPIDEVFAFFADPQNLPRLSPPDLEVKVGRLELVPPGFIPPEHATRSHQFAGAGTMVEVKFRAPEFPLPMAHDARITEFV